MIDIGDSAFPSVDQFFMAVKGMRNPFNSWDRSDSDFCDAFGWFEDGGGLVVDPRMTLGEKDLGLMKRLCLGGPEHRKFLRQLPVTLEITAPLYWWKQMDQYKVGTVTDSCSTMHKLTDRPFEPGDFSPLGDGFEMDATLETLNGWRDTYVETKDMRYWRAINGLLPQGYNQKRTWSGNYEVLRTICRQRAGHKLSEWADFIDWIRERAPFAEELVFDNWDLE